MPDKLIIAEKSLLKPLLLMWLFVSVILIFGAREIIVTRAGWDPDDQLRLVQLRDFLAGQSWFDTTQYRLNPPNGGPMHWSRLIELPLAFVILITRPLFGEAIAEMIAGTIVPLIGLGLVAYILGRVATHLGNAQAGIIAIILTVCSTPLLPQFQPMRIDHHGWQTVLAVLSLWTIFWSNKKRGGIVLGLALATWLHISLEGLPAAAAFFLLLGWRWVFEKAHGQRLMWTIASFSLGSLLLFFGTQTNWVSPGIYCDTISPPYIAAILFAAVIMLPAIIATPDDRRWRLAATIGAGTAAIAAILMIAPQCSRGAFGNLDPLVRDYWYVHVNEGLPIWYQYAKDAIVLIATPLCGVPALILLLARPIGGAANKDLKVAGYFLIYSIILSVLVIRTVSVATAFAIPLLAVWISGLFTAYRQSLVPKTRIMLVALMLFLIIPGALIAQGIKAVEPLFAEPEKARDVAIHAADEKCQSVQSVAALSKLPKGNFIAPFDIGPTILMTTPHSVLASSHHRNEIGMHDHIEIWRSLPAKSFALIKKHNIQYIAACPSEAEMEFYVDNNPKGLWSLLSTNAAPAWLETMPDMGKGIKVWRVRH